MRQDAMTSACTVADLRQRSPLGRARGFVFAIGVACVGLLGCETLPERSLSPAEPAVAPYAALIAVAPFTNESGVPVTAENVFRVSDALVGTLNRVQGWNAVPLNRTVQAMQELGISQIPDLATAATLVEAMGVDAIVLGTITQWDPYDPPRFGANIILLANEGVASGGVNARELTGTTGDGTAAHEGLPRQMAQVIGVYDAADHSTLLRLQTYAASRIDVTGGFDPPERYYLMVFQRFIEFGAWCLVDQLLADERSR